MDNDFDSVSWQNEPDSDISRPNTAQADHGPSIPGKRKAKSGSAQAGQAADEVDLAGIGMNGRLDCTVNAPLKENDGTKDAYVSYLVTTHVCLGFESAARSAIRRSRLYNLLMIRLRPISHPFKNYS